MGQVASETLEGDMHGHPCPADHLNHCRWWGPPPLLTRRDMPMDGCLVTASLWSVCLLGTHACAVESLKFSLLIFLPLDILCRHLLRSPATYQAGERLTERESYKPVW